MLLDNPMVDHERVTQMAPFTSCQSAINSKDKDRIEIESQTKEWLRRNRLKEVPAVIVPVAPVATISKPSAVTIPAHIPRPREGFIKKPTAGKSGHLFLVMRGDRYQVYIKDKSYGYFTDLIEAISVRDKTLKSLGLNEYGWTSQDAEKYERQLKASNGGKPVGAL